MANKSIFISYSSRHRFATAKFVEFLEHQGYDNGEIFWDKYLVPAQDWREELKSEIRGRDIFLYLLTPESIKSVYCQNEYNLAADEQKLFIPVATHPEISNLPDQIRRTQIIDFTSDIPRAEMDLLETLKGEKFYRLKLQDKIDPIFAVYHLDEIIEEIEDLLRKAYINVLYAIREGATHLDGEYHKPLFFHFQELRNIYVPIGNANWFNQVLKDLEVHLQHVAIYRNSYRVDEADKLAEQIKNSAIKALNLLSQIRWQ